MVLAFGVISLVGLLVCWFCLVGGFSVFMWFDCGWFGLRVFVYRLVGWFGVFVVWFLGCRVVAIICFG